LDVVESQKENQHSRDANPYFSGTGKDEHPKQEIGCYKQNDAEHHEIQTKYEDTASTVSHFPYS
jgi:hypothetical protein